MKPLNPVILIPLLLILFQSHAQKIHWADQLIFQHNAYSETEYSGQQLVGSPDASPYGKLSKNAFRLNDERSYGIVSVGYREPIQVSQIIIVENYLPNHISKVILKDTDGKEHLIYEPRNELSSLPSRVLNINIEKTNYKVKAVTIHLNTYDRGGWAQIDAIGISETIQSESDLAKLINTDEFDYEENIRFADEKEKLSPNVNTEYGEAKPIISPDGRTLYFVRKYSPQNLGGKDDEQDIYYSNFINGRWTVAQNIGWPLNDKYPNGICSVSPDGNTIWLLNDYDVETGTVQDGISVSHRTEDGGWSQPEGLKIANFVNNNEFQDYSVSASGNILLLAIETNESVGEQDIYVSFKKQDDTWTEPQNLGRSINTEFVEYSPLLSADEKVLFFASTGHGSTNGGDIFYSQRLDETWMNWSTPKNIGFEVNTEDGLDSYFTISPNYQEAYFVSTANVDNQGDIEFSGMDIYRIPINQEPEPKKVLALSGKVFDQSDNDPVYAKINLSSSSGVAYQGFTTSNIKTGEYNIKVSDKVDYFITAQAEGYLNYSDTITFSEGGTDDFTYHIPMEKVAKGRKFALNNLFFIQSKADLLPESEPELERLYNLMTNNPTLKIKLGGHTDNRGYRLANMRLSHERADAVKDYLVNKGIDDKRIKTEGYGPSQPVAPNDTEENRARNRRVEVEILDI